MSIIRPMSDKLERQTTNRQANKKSKIRGCTFIRISSEYPCTVNSIEVDSLSLRIDIKTLSPDREFQLGDTNLKKWSASQMWKKWPRPPGIFFFFFFLFLPRIYDIF